MRMTIGEATVKPTWIVIANKAQARCLAHTDTDDTLIEVWRLHHPDSRARDAALTSTPLGHGRGAATYAPRLDPKQKAGQQFAQAVAARLNQGVAAHVCGALVLLASAPFLGELRQRLDRQAAKAVRSVQSVDLTAMSGDDLNRRVHAALVTPAP